MSRVYSAKYIEELKSLKEEAPTPALLLADACVRAKVPAVYIAEGLDVPKTKVYGWFRGSDTPAETLAAIEALTEFLERELTAGVLPANNKTARGLIQQWKGYREGNRL